MKRSQRNDPRPLPQELREVALVPYQAKRWLLRLYVMGMTPLSALAVRTVCDVCERHLSGDYELEVHDLSQRNVLGGDEVVATPMLVRVRPGPERKLVGKLDRSRLLQELEISRGGVGPHGRGGLA
jgi:circadian clock protein KaiB